jgi:hypothetical protein
MTALAFWISCDLKQSSSLRCVRKRHEATATAMLPLCYRYATAAAAAAAAADDTVLVLAGRSRVLSRSYLRIRASAFLRVTRSERGSLQAP